MVSFNLVSIIKRAVVLQKDMSLVGSCTSDDKVMSSSELCLTSSWSSSSSVHQGVVLGVAQILLKDILGEGKELQVALILFAILEVLLGVA